MVPRERESFGTVFLIQRNPHNQPTTGKQPFVGKVLSIERLGGRDKERDVSHIVIDTGGVQYVEGQSFGVQPPVRTPTQSSTHSP